MASHARALPPELEYMIIPLLIQDLRNYRLGEQPRTDDNAPNILERKRNYTTRFRLVCKGWDIAMCKEIVRQLPLSEITTWSRDSVLLCEAVERLLPPYLPVDSSERPDVLLRHAANWVASTGCVAALKLLLEAGVSASTESLVREAVQGNHGDVIRLLASYGADFNVFGTFIMEYPLVMAVKRSHVDAAVALMDSDVTFVPSPGYQMRFDGHRLLERAAANGDMLMMTEILKRVHTAVDFFPAARIAVRTNDMEMLQLFVDYGFSPDPGPGPFLAEEKLLLTYAIKTGHFAIFQRLLQLGASYSLADEFGQAMRHGQTKMAKALLLSQKSFSPYLVDILTSMEWFDGVQRLEAARMVLEVYPSCSRQLLDAAIDRYGNPAMQETYQQPEGVEVPWMEDAKLEVDAFDLLASHSLGPGHDDDDREREYFQLLFEHEARNAASDGGNR